VLYGADLLLETDSAGHGNWEFNSTSTESDDTDYGEGEALPVVHNVLVRDVNVQFLDGVNGQTHKFTLTNLDLSTDGIDTPLSLAMEAIYNNENISVEGEMGSVAALSSDGMFPVKLEISSLGARVQLNGTVKKPRSASGVNIGFDVTGDDMAAIASRGMAMAGVDGSASLPEKSIALKGALRDVDGGFAIDGLGMKIGDSDLAGNISFNLAGIRPSVIADLSSNHFDSVDIQPTPSQGNTTPDTGPDDGRVFPDDPISLDGLNSVDASVKFSGKDVVTNGVTLGNVDADLTLKNGALNVRSFGFDFGGGRIEGDVQLSDAKLAIAADARKIDYGRILKEMTGEEALSGMMDVSITAKGAGNSVRSIMAGLDGKLRVVSEDGHIDIDALNVPSGPLTDVLVGDINDLQCAVVDFDIVQGMATSKTILVETDGLSVIGEGGIDLREEKLNLYFDPRAKSASVVSVAEIGISVGGTLKDPSFTADKADVLLGAASLATGIATGGVSILLGAVLDTVANEIDSTDYCALALAGKPLQPGQPAGDVPSSPKQQEQPPVQEETPEENPVEGLLNNLLGN
ncbi:MAG: AsmA family protein, partial [Rhodospirillales bacterium]|nr:AsmA family protein [Rhodospirillales bacterium]